MGDAQRRAEEASAHEIQHNGVATASSANDKIYEPKGTKKIIRVLTVVAYVFFVSLAAIMLSAYYVFLWTPNVPKRERVEYFRDPQPMPNAGPASSQRVDMGFSSSLSYPVNMQMSTEVPALYERPTYNSQEDDVDDVVDPDNNVDIAVDTGT